MRSGERSARTLSTMTEDYFGEEAAALYDDDDDDPMFSAEVVGPTVEFLAELAGSVHRP